MIAFKSHEAHVPLMPKYRMNIAGTNFTQEKCEEGMIRCVACFKVSVHYSSKHVEPICRHSDLIASL